MSRLEVLAADDERVVENVALEDARMRFVEGLDADVVIWIGRVPVEARRHGAARHDGGDGEGAIGRLLGVRLHHVGDGSIRTHADRLRGYTLLILRLDFARMSRLGSGDRGHVRAAVDLTAAGDDGAGEAVEIFENVKLPLIRPPQRGPRVVVGDRRAMDFGDVARARSMRGSELLVEHLLLVVRPKEEIAVDAPEVAVDPLEPNDLLDAIDGGHVALDDEPSVGFAVDRLEVVDAVVHRPSEVGRRCARSPRRRSVRRR